MSSQAEGELRRVPPDYCKYADGPCDQDFSQLTAKGAFFAFPSVPPQIAATVVAAAKRLETDHPGNHVTWREMSVEGQIIFCEICKAFRESTTIFADITTLNLNLMFEIGFGIGLGLPVIPIRDTNYDADKGAFQEIGILDTLGYISFSNHEELAEKAAKALPGRPLPPPLAKKAGPDSLYLIKFRFQTDADLELNKLIKKSKFSFISYDPNESSRLSLADARRNVASSFGVIGHLLSSNRQGALTHNALTALICGMAVAQQKFVLMLQEERQQQPIDYRDIVKHYTTASQIKALFDPIFTFYVDYTQNVGQQAAGGPAQPLEQLDLGDIAAENEIRGLRSYFIRTGQFNQAKQGHARLVVGRKGSGKTAIYYGVLQSLPFSPSNTVLDLKPEGHQFTRMKEAVLARMTAGLQEHTMTAFWNYILLTELARKIVYRENHLAYSNPTTVATFERIKQLYGQHDTGQDEDFPQRLSRHITRISTILSQTNDDALSGAITNHLYSQDIRSLNDAVGEWLKDKEYVWILVDNIDKGWPTRGSTIYDIVIVKSLLEATRKLQKQLRQNDVEVSSLVFIRADIYDHLQSETADKGKDTAIVLEWNDPESFKEIVRQRIVTSLGASGDFEKVWSLAFETHVDGEYAFDFVLARTLQRPRELLLFLRRAVEVALNRGHVRATADDFKQAAVKYSDDLLFSTAYEIQATHPEFDELLYYFELSPPTLSREQLDGLLRDRGVTGETAVQAIELLLEFGFLGVKAAGAEPTYAYEVRHSLDRLLANSKQPEAVFVVHPGYRAALKIAS